MPNYSIVSTKPANIYYSLIHVMNCRYAFCGNTLWLKWLMTICAKSSLYRLNDAMIVVFWWTLTNLLRWSLSITTLKLPTSNVRNSRGCWTLEVHWNQNAFVHVCRNYSKQMSMYVTVACCFSRILSSFWTIIWQSKSLNISYLCTHAYTLYIYG